MDLCPPGRKKSGRCGEVAVSGGTTKGLDLEAEPPSINIC